MALSIGNETYDLRNPSGSSFNFSHTQDVGADGHLFVMINLPNAGATITSITYNGVGLTALSQQISGIFNHYWEIWEIDAPATGSNTLQVNLSGGFFNSISTWVLSATGCSGAGNIVFDDTVTSPNNGSITVSENSVIMAGLQSGNTTSNAITLDGSSRTLAFEHTLGNVHAGALSLTGLTSGSKTTQVSANTSVGGFTYKYKKLVVVVVEKMKVVFYNYFN